MVVTWVEGGRPVDTKPLTTKVSVSIQNVHRLLAAVPLASVINRGTTELLRCSNSIIKNRL